MILEEEAEYCNHLLLIETTTRLSPTVSGLKHRRHLEAHRSRIQRSHPVGSLPGIATQSPRADPVAETTPPD